MDSFNIIHLELMMQKVDIFVLGGDLLDRRQIEGRRLAVVARDPDQSFYLPDFTRGYDPTQARLVPPRGGMKAGRLDLESLRGTSADVGLVDLLVQGLRARGHHDVKEPDR